MKPEAILSSWLETTNIRLKIKDRPLVTLSYAQSLDGSIARERGKPLVLSGPESMRLTHQLRAAHDAILAGIGTVQADNPQLTVRLVEGDSPIPVILDTHLKISPTARLFENRKKPILACRDSAARSDRAQELLRAGATLLSVKSDRNGHLSLPELVMGLFERGIKSVMVEGGAQVIGAFLQQDLVDRIMLTITPVYIGGLKALENASSEQSEVREVSAFTAGRDIILLGEFAR